MNQLSKEKKKRTIEKRTNKQRIYESESETTRRYATVLKLNQLDVRFQMNILKHLKNLCFLFKKKNIIEQYYLLDKKIPKKNRCRSLTDCQS